MNIDFTQNEVRVMRAMFKRIMPVFEETWKDEDPMKILPKLKAVRDKFEGGCF